MSVSFSISRAGLSRRLAASVVGVLVLASVLMAAPAHAAAPDFTATNGIEYLVDASTHTATATGYLPYVGGLEVEIPATIEVNLESYAVTAIGSYSFNERALTSVILNEGLVSIGEAAFWGNSLTSVVVPASVTSFASGVFGFAPQPAQGTLAVIFAGAAPTTITGAVNPYPSLGTATVHYLAEFGGTGGFSPNWAGYTTVIDHMVSFNLNAPGSIDPQRLAAGDLAVAPPVPVRENYTFDGWFSDAALTTAFDFSAATLDDVTLFAKWIAVTAPVVPPVDVPTETAPAATLPATGFDGALLSTLSLLSVLAGGSLLVGRRRRVA